jgi:hypothetical protein
MFFPLRGTFWQGYEKKQFYQINKANDRLRTQILDKTAYPVENSSPD